MSRNPRIGIWGHYHGGNLGDDLVVSAMIHNFRERLPDVELLAFSLGPRDSSRRHGLTAFPIRRGNWETAASRAIGGDLDESDSALDPATTRRNRLRAPAWLRRAASGLRVLWESLSEIRFAASSARQLRGVDLLVLAGSGPLSDDWRGPWSHPYAVYKWSWLARAMGARLAMPSIGAGPIDLALTRRMLKAAVSRTAYRSFRDESSARLIASLDAPGENPVVPDMAFGYPVRVAPLSGDRLVGVNPLPYFHHTEWHPHDAEAYDTYLQKMADFLAWLLAGDRQALLLYSDLQGDPPVAEDLRRILVERGQHEVEKKLLEPEINGVEDLIREMRRCDSMVSGRYHCILVPALLGIPVVGLSYHPKTDDLMRTLGQEEYCLDIARFEVADLIDRFEDLERNQVEVRRILEERVAPQRAQVLAQFDELVKLI